MRSAGHACDACGGSGVQIAGWIGDVPKYGPCPVCLGAGRISNRMPAADALADAETLHLYLYGHDWLLSYKHLALAERTGLSAVRDIQLLDARENRPSAWEIGPDTAGCATVAARAAFRAVPGLRGE